MSTPSSEGFLFFDPFDGSLNCIDLTSGHTVKIKPHTQAEDGPDLNFTMPMQYAKLGFKNLLTLGPTGLIESGDPGEYLADLALATPNPVYDNNEFISIHNDIETKVNAIIAALIAKHILQPATIAILPEPAVFRLEASGPPDLVVGPASFGLGAWQEFVPEIKFGGTDPTVIVG